MKSINLTGIATITMIALFGAGCSGAPDHLPGGREAQAAATAKGEELGNALGRGITRSEDLKAKGDLEAAQRVLEQYGADASSYPQAGSCAELAGALGPLARSLRISGSDPWGHGYECRSSERGYTLRSYGADGNALSEDDIVVEGGSSY